MQFSFAIEGRASKPGEAGWPIGAENRLRVDNVNYATPAYYVSPTGSDKSDGRSEKTAFATPQKALDAAQPGDIVLLMEGLYKAGQVPVASFPGLERPMPGSFSRTIPASTRL